MWGWGEGEGEREGEGEGEDARVICMQQTLQKAKFGGGARCVALGRGCTLIIHPALRCFITD